MSKPPMMIKEISADAAAELKGGTPQYIPPTGNPVYDQGDQGLWDQAGWDYINGILTRIFQNIF